MFDHDFLLSIDFAPMKVGQRNGVWSFQVKGDLATRTGVRWGQDEMASEAGLKLHISRSTGPVSAPH